MCAARKSAIPGRTLTRGVSTAVAWLLASAAAAQLADASRVNPRSLWADPPERFTSRVVATGFEDPWEVAYGPDGFLWITERVGKRVVRVNPANGTRTVAVRI